MDIFEIFLLFFRRREGQRLFSLEQTASGETSDISRSSLAVAFLPSEFCCSKVFVFGMGAHFSCAVNWVESLVEGVVLRFIMMDI